MNNLAISLDSRASTQRPRLYIKGRMWNHTHKTDL
jgi:hypothetical protein